MKTYGCPYNADMILAKIANIKTQSRRVGKIQNPEWKHLSIEYISHATKGSQALATYRAFPKDGTARCGICTSPRGIIGDRQYWQEAFDFRMPAAGFVEIRYKADKVTHVLEVAKELNCSDFKRVLAWKQPDIGKWRGMPAMFMLRSMSRGMDEIVDVRVERAQDITHDDAKAEGVESFAANQDTKNILAHNYRASYAKLWDAINAARGFSWQSNPWVWIYTTKEIKP